MAFLIKHCQLLRHKGYVDVRLRGDCIKDVTPALAETPDETAIDAAGGLLLPGLHDHHIHLVSLAASMASVHCGPPGVNDAQQLEERLARENSRKPGQWLRGIGYHNSVAGDIDRHWLDTVAPDRPVRIQHRGGRLWILNTKALEALDLMDGSPADDLPEGVEFEGKHPSGRFYECDRWLRKHLKTGFPCLAEVSQLLAGYGVTGITDTSPSNGADEWAYFLRSQAERKLLQQVRMMGAGNLPEKAASGTLQLGEFKVHLLESQLPDFDTLLGDIHQARQSGRNVAIHCVTRTELVFALACLETAAVTPGDRIEHASVTPPELLEKIATLGLRVVTQPHFIYQRGEHYRQEVEAMDQPWLYRLRGFLEAGVPLAAGSDAPFGSPNPWVAMQAAVSRQTDRGTSMAQEEALSPEKALELYTSDARYPGVKQRIVQAGNQANLCLLRTGWETVRERLDKASVMATWVDGRLIYRQSLC